MQCATENSAYLYFTRYARIHNASSTSTFYSIPKTIMKQIDRNRKLMGIENGYKGKGSIVCDKCKPEIAEVNGDSKNTQNPRLQFSSPKFLRFVVIVNEFHWSFPSYFIYAIVRLAFTKPWFLLYTGRRRARPTQFWNRQRLTIFDGTLAGTNRLKTFTKNKCFR